MLTIAAMINDVMSVVSDDNMSSTKGLPRKMEPHTINSFIRNLPANVAVANFHGLYLASPSGIYTISSGIGVRDAINAPNQPYLLTRFCSGRILFFVLSLRILRP